MTKTLLVLSLVLLGTVGCQPVLDLPTRLPLPTSTPLPTATDTPVPPTLFPTTVPATPTSSPTPKPPIPTADFTLTEIVGTWVRSDPERGDLFLTFFESGDYRASHGTPDGVVHAGMYTLEGRLLTFVDGWNCSPLPDTTPGWYVLRLASGGKWLYLDHYEDDCPDRPSALRNFRWTRFVPTPTATP